MQANTTLRQLFFRHIGQTSPEPLALEIEGAEGIYFYAPGGAKRYIDAISGVSVSNMGHGHPRILQALHAQADRCLHSFVYGELVVAPQVRLAEYLCAQLPKELDSVYFVNSGSEAVEGALKLAKRHTGRRDFVAFRNAYHGSTHGAASLMSDEYFTSAYRPLLPNVRFIDFNRRDDLLHIDESVAGVVVEIVRAEAGIELPAPGYLQALQERCRQTGALLIVDEIQTGCGRTGSLFAFEQHGLLPDILLLAKAFGGGMPLGAFVASRSLMQSLSQDPVLGHITTFGGHALCCAVALAALQALLQEGHISQVQAKSDRLAERLLHPKIRQIRRAGLMFAVDLGDADLVRRFIRQAIENGAVMDWFLFNPYSVRIAPPLIISPEQIDELADIFLKTLDQL